MKRKIINAIKNAAVLILSMVVAFGISSALTSRLGNHATMVQPEFEIGGMHTGDNTPIGPGDTMNLGPYATNTCSAEIFISASIRQELVEGPKFKDDPAAEPYMVPDINSAPVYTYELNDGWHLVNEAVEDNYITSTYVYTAALKPEGSSLPVFDQATMQDFTVPCYATAIHDINISANFTAVPADEKNSLTAPEI